MVSGRRAVLREHRPEDFDRLSAMRNNLALQRQLMALPRPNSPERVSEWLARRSGDARTLFFVIADQATNRARGFIQLAELDFVHGVGELGICLDEGEQGQGYGAEAISLLEGHAREVFGVRKVILRVLANNAPAIRLYERLGYRTVGIHERHFRAGDEFLDVRLMEKALEARP